MRKVLGIGVLLVFWIVLPGQAQDETNVHEEEAVIEQVAVGEATEEAFDEVPRERAEVPIAEFMQQLEAQEKLIDAKQEEVERLMTHVRNLEEALPQPPEPVPLLPGVPPPIERTALPAIGPGVHPLEEIETRAFPLERFVPQNMLGMMEPLLGPHGRFEYDPDSGVLVLQGGLETIKRAEDFLDSLGDAYSRAVELNAEVEAEERIVRQTYGMMPGVSFTGSPGTEHSEPTAIQIEVLVLVGEKDGETSLPGTNSTLPYTIPGEAASLGLSPEDMLPFGFDQINAIGPTILQTVLAPPNEGVRNAFGKLGEYRIEFTVKPRFLELEVSDEDETLMSSNLKAVFDRPILIATYTGDVDGTVVLAVRLKKID